MFVLRNQRFIINKVCSLDKLVKSSLLQKPSKATSCIVAHSHVPGVRENWRRLTKKPPLISPYTFSLPLSTVKSSSNVVDENTDTQEQDDKQSKENEKSWKYMKYGMILMGASLSLAGMTVIYEMVKPNYDEGGNLIEDEFSHLPLIQQIYKRLQREISYFKKFVQEPSREKLLPDPLQHPYIQPPYTVVMEMTHVLVHPDWTYQTGWRFKKRPGIDHFLEEIAPPQFETVVYTAEQGMTAFPIIDALDPQGFIMYRLVRDATRFVNGHHVKDLDSLNRDLSKVIVIDWDSNSVQFHPENTLKIPRWSGNDDDTTLYDLAAFLKTIYVSKVDDVRDVLNYYRQFDNPLETFRENQKKLLVQLEEEEHRMQKEENKVLTRWRPSFLRNF